MNRDNWVMYFYMVLGTIGIVLVGLGTLRYQFIYKDFEGYGVTFLGFLLTISYIKYLERKVGISKKISWINSIITMILFIIISYLLYF